MEEIKKILEEVGPHLLGEIFLIRDFWEKSGINFLKENAVPTKITRGTLYIAVKHPVWKNEILMNRDLLIKKIKEETGIEIKEIKVEIARTTPRLPRGNRKKELRAVRDPLSEEDLSYILTRVNGPASKNRILRLLKKTHGRRKR